MDLVGVQLGNYQLLRQLGRGSMGEVFLARDRRIDRHVAIKIVQHEPYAYLDIKDVQAAERLFQREMQIISRFDHPNILPLYDFGEEVINKEKFMYMVMPYRQEGSLFDWLRQFTASRLSPQQVSHMVRQAAEGLQTAHDANIVHQDVKPSNFLVRARRDQPEFPDLLLADFGIAKVMNATATMNQNLRGTPAYMAPEHWEGHPVPATDQYALAIMTYELLIGRPPFQGNAMQVMYRHISDQPLPPSQLNPHLSTAIDAVILTALAKQPAQRYSSVIDFARAFQQALADEAMMPVVEKETPLPPTIAADQPSFMPSSFSAEIAPITPARTTNPDQRAFSAISMVPPPPPAYSPPNPAARMNMQKTPWGRVAASVAAVCLLIVAGVLLYSGYQGHAQQLHAHMTATALAHVTATAHAQATISVNITATVIAGNHYPAYLPGSGVLELAEPLDHASAWKEEADKNFGGSCAYKDGAYHITQSIAQRFYYCSSDYNYSDVAIQVDMTIVKGDCGGVTFRQSQAQEYYFRVCQDGDATLYKYMNASPESAVALLPNAPVASVHRGLNQKNMLAIVAQGHTISLYVNTTQVGNTITDSTFTSGAIGFSGEAQQQATEVAYQNVMLWSV